MASKKPRRKKHNPNKRAERFFSKCRIFTWEADREHSGDIQNAVAEARTIRGWERLNGDVASAIVRHRNNWIICVRALCQNANGEEWVEQEVRIVRGRVLQEFEDWYHDMRTQVLAAQRLDQVVDVGWICGTFRTTPDDEGLSIHGLGASTPERRAMWREVNADYQSEQREAA